MWMGLWGGPGCFLPMLTPTTERAVTTTLGAAGTIATSPLVKPPPRPCKEHHARPTPDSKCEPIPCGGRCGPDQRCDEIALVPTCIPR